MSGAKLGHLTNIPPALFDKLMSLEAPKTCESMV